MKEYKNEHIIVHWFPEVCAHPGICLRLLPEVFNLQQRPWVNVDAAEPEVIISAIDKCPSGALRYSIPEGSKVDTKIAYGVGNIDFERSNPASVINRVSANGPLSVEGQTAVIGGKMALCRCGLSKSRPFCDGTHLKQG